MAVALHKYQRQKLDVAVVLQHQQTVSEDVAVEGTLYPSLAHVKAMCNALLLPQGCDSCGGHADKRLQQPMQHHRSLNAVGGRHVRQFRQAHGLEQLDVLRYVPDSKKEQRKCDPKMELKDMSSVVLQSTLYEQRHEQHRQQRMLNLLGDPNRL